jgi:hypothetical protein
MRLSATAKWIGLALLGLAISAAVAIAASNLVSRQIGIASESVSAGDALAPAVESAARQDDPAGTGSGDPPAAVAEPEAGDAGGEDESAEEFEARLDEREDALKDREDAREDLEDAREDALKDREDNSGSGSDD